MTATTTKTIDGSWKAVATGAAKVLIYGPPFGYEVSIGASAPAATDAGIPINDESGTFAASDLDSGDNVYARVKGGGTSASTSVQVMAA